MTPAKPAVFRRLPGTPVPADPAELDQEILTTFFACGIVNPMSPTFWALVSNGLPDPGVQSKIYLLCLNPFRQTCSHIGSVVHGDPPEGNRGESLEEPEGLEELLRPGWGGCPTLLVPSAMFGVRQTTIIAARYLENLPDGLPILAKIEKHPGNPWARVQSDMDGVGKTLSQATGRWDALKKMLKSLPTNGPLGKEKAERFAQLQMAPEPLKEEFRAFLAAWAGSLEFLKVPGMSQEDFLRVFFRLAVTCRLPFLQNTVDNPEILGRKPENCGFPRRNKSGAILNPRP